MNCNEYYMKNLPERQILRRRAFLHLSGQGLRFRLLVIAVIWLLASDCSFADKVFLIDGDIIEGVITNRTTQLSYWSIATWDEWRFQGAASNP